MLSLVDSATKVTIVRIVLLFYYMVLLHDLLAIAKFLVDVSETVPFHAHVRRQTDSTVVILMTMRLEHDEMVV